MAEELWTTREIAEYLGYKINSVNPWLIRHKIKRRCVTRDAHGRTVNLYRADDIRRERPKDAD